jgi:hypothetical protein
MNEQKKKHMNANELRDALRRMSRDALLICIAIQHDGAVYDLDSQSEFRIKERYPDATPLESIMLGHRREADFERLNRPRWEPMVLLLTGLTPEQIADLGGVRIYDIEQEQVVWQWKPEVVRS